MCSLRERELADMQIAFSETSFCLGACCLLEGASHIEGEHFCSCSVSVTMTKSTDQKQHRDPLFNFTGSGPSLREVLEGIQVGT